MSDLPALTKRERKILLLLTTNLAEQTVTNDDASILTPAEDQLVCSVLAGNTSGKMLMRCMGISQSTVQVHLWRIRRKTGCYNMADLVLWAWRNGYELPEQTDEA